MDVHGSKSQRYNEFCTSNPKCNVITTISNSSIVESAKNMAGWISNNQKPNSGGLDGNEMVMGLVFSHKSGLDLMQNCDLPPPLKVFSGPDKTVLSSMNRICSMMVQDDENDDDLRLPGNGYQNEKLELLKALRLSQTRAREAEKKAAVLAKEKDCLCNALLAESSQLFAYRHWVQLLELQLSKLQRQFCGGSGRMNVAEDDGEDVGSVTWFMAFALCLGIAGVSFAFGCRYLF
ncbi:hypothetical protein F0562_003194 [Nyssa sinensis]|uniref:Uncharacterized protein n=1 Tax=Nyssa sinensis TaxID=561372 RepID=A0A5J5BUP7_9ASTE|nr:hypothetical protein F0562_003194 [Nyssa sinensis]